MGEHRRRIRVAGAMAALALAGAACTPAAVTSTEPAPPPTSAVTSTTVVDEAIPTDPAVTIGHLDNGLTYYVRENTRPGGRAQLRLVVDAGSREESPDQSGAAHFLEHMLFNGTEAYPANRLVDVLEGFGSEFGPHINAYTSYDETVYQLNVPTDDPTTLDTALGVLREWASKATLDPTEVDAERGVIVEEWRVRDLGLAGRVTEATTNLLLAGTPWQDKEPIGDIDVVRNLQPTDLADFYHSWYRPDRMAVVAVGDFDGADVEARIRALFGDLTGPADPPQEDQPTVTPRREIVVERLADADATLGEVGVYFHLPPLANDSVSGLEAATARQLAFLMLDTRIEDDIDRGEFPALSVVTSIGDSVVRGGELYGFDLSVRPDQVEAATTALATIVEQARRYGFDQSEFDRRLTSSRSLADQAYAGRTSTQDAQYATAYVANFLSGMAIPDAGTAHDLTIAALDRMTPERVRTALDEMLTGDAPAILAVGPDDGTLPESAAFSTAWSDVVAGEVAPRVDQGVPTEELMSRPDPMPATRTETVSGTNIQHLTFANGIEVYSLETQIDANSVTVLAGSLGGSSVYPPQDLAEAYLIPQIVDQSGLAGIDRVTLERILTGQEVGFSPYIDTVDEGFYGQSASEDIETLFQLAHLYMSDPQADRVQADKALDQLAPYAADPASVPQLAIQLALDRARYGDDPWYRAIPTEAELADFDLDRALAIYRDRFVDAGDFVYVVVGDVGAAEVRDLAGRYLGTLPTARTTEEFVDRRPDPPGGVVDERVEAGTGDQGSVLLAYAAPYVVDQQDDLGLQVLELILDGRLRDRLREQLGATYSPSVTIQAVDRPDRIIDSQILIGNDPARVDEIGTEARRVVDDLVSAGPTADEFATAVEQVRRRIELFSNPSLASAILSTALRGEGLDDYLRRDQLLAELTIGDVERLATVAFPPRRYVEIRQVPEGF